MGLGLDMGEVFSVYTPLEHGDCPLESSFLCAQGEGRVGTAV